MIGKINAGAAMSRQRSHSGEMIQTDGRLGLVGVEMSSPRDAIRPPIQVVRCDAPEFLFRLFFEVVVKIVECFGFRTGPSE